MRRGSTMVETSFALLVLLLMSLAIVDTGRYLYAANLVAYLAREGARQASLGEAQNVDPFLRPLAAGLAVNRLKIETRREESAVTVHIAYDFTPATGVLLGRDVPVTAHARLPLPSPAP